MRKTIFIALSTTISLTACDLLGGASCEAECESDDECDVGLSCIGTAMGMMCLPDECRSCDGGCSYSTNEEEVQSEGALYTCDFRSCN
jgi:hypothetical protein